MARKKKGKENIDEFDEDLEENEKNGSKVITILIAVFIVLIWLAIFALLIKADVGGFGSNVLRPVLKDVPVVNKILPKASDQEFFDENDTSYDSLESAVSRIKELELQLESEKEKSSDYKDTVKDLKAQIKKLKVYKEDADNLEDKIKDFDKNVVYNDNAPSIEEYQKYYAEMNPDNAEEIYRQVVEQMQYDQKVQDESDRYAKMEPAAAAQVLEIMSADDLDTVCGIISCMNKTKAALIMAQLDPATSAKITKRLTAKNE